MRVCFFHSDKPREIVLAEAFTAGVKIHGDDAVTRAVNGEPQIAADAQVAVMVGVKSRELFYANKRAGVRVVMLDKGYSRHKCAGQGWEFWRVAVNNHQPTQYLGRTLRPPDRWERLGLKMAPWRASGSQVVFAGSSAKYHEFHGFPDPTRFAEKVFRRLRSLTNREIVYRPKPSWRDAEPIAGTTFSRHPESIFDLARDAHVLITHGSNACFEAVLAGLPCIVLGEAVAKSISSTDLDDVENPRLASDEERHRWAYDLAYSQWTLGEFASGEAWATIGPLIYG